MKLEDLKKFEKKLTAAIKAHLDGGKLHAGGFVSYMDNSICPLTCLLGLNRKTFKRVTGNSNIAEAVSQKVRIPFSDDDMWKFIAGFDHPPFAKTNLHARLFLLGRKIRKNFLPY